MYAVAFRLQSISESRSDWGMRGSGNRSFIHKREGSKAIVAALVPNYSY